MTTIQRVAVGMAAAVALSVAVWAVVSAPATRAAPAVRAPAEGRTVVLDNGSEGSSVSVVVGARLRVNLTGRSGMRWSAIVGSPTGGPLVHRSGSQSSDGSSSAVFTAVRTGRMTLTSTGAPICAPGAACPQYRVLWRVSVVVGPTASS